MHTRKGQLFTELVLEIFKLNGLLVTEGDQLTQGVGLTSARWKVLGAIALSQTEMTVPQIAQTMGQTRQSVQRIANSMSDEGILMYKNNPAHKRAKLLSLTEEGKKIFDALQELQSPWANHSAKDISITDLKIALSVIRHLIDKFES